MKKILILLLLSYLNSTISYCQLLSKPSLTVKDFEKSLTNAAHLRQILKKLNFEYSNYSEYPNVGETKFNAGYLIINPLFPDLRTFKSEGWILKNQRNQAIFKVNIFEWVPNHAPQPEVINTIRIMIDRNSIDADKMDKFLEKIENKYPNKSKRYFRNTEFYQQFGKPLIVFTNDSKIEVREELEETSNYPFYTVSFDLIK